MTDTAAAVSRRVEFPRKFVAAEADFGTWATAERYYQALAERQVVTREDFDQWLFDWSEVDACFDEAGISRQVDYTRQTDDPRREKRHLDFVEAVKPKREPWIDKLRHKLAAYAARLSLPPKRYEVLVRSAGSAIQLFREANIPLLTDDEKMRQRYQKIAGAMSVTFDGREQTMQQMSLYLEEPDRGLREKTWRLAADRFLQEKDALNELYGRMIDVRHRMALNAGCRDYRAYMFKRLERFDYTPEHCLAFHDAIEKVVVPAAGKLADERREKLKLQSLRPWDFDVDPDNRPPLRPFETEQQLIDGCRRIFDRINPDFRVIFDTLAANESLDLSSRKGKAPGGYQETFQERRMPFIFMNAVGTPRDLDTLLHEGGHAFHTWACRGDPLLAYRNYPMEIAEVASMSMECLALPHLEEIYGKKADRARKRHLIEIITFLPWMARVDAFQHYVYTNVEHDTPRRLDEWQQLTRRFAPHQDWTGLAEYDRHLWHRKLHFFEVPFYYIEYGIAQLGALQVWMNAMRDPVDAVARYRAGLALGGSRPLPELFETAGCSFDFTEKTLRPLIDAVMAEIARL